MTPVEAPERGTAPATPPAPATAFRGESRWPVVVAVLVVFVILASMPARVRAMPFHTPFLMTAMVLIPMIGAHWKGAVDRRWLVAERTVTLTITLLLGIVNVLVLMAVVRSMLKESDRATAMVLLSSGVGTWITNILVFSLAYWQMDRGGPEGRAKGSPVLPDWQFPQSSMTENVRPGWRPTYVDYLAISFNTATAFSPTDVVPLTHSAKLLLMLESLISLVTLAIVASRAINVLGS
jgi:hypothetical protein